MLQEILSQCEFPAFLVGNGIHLYDTNEEDRMTWEKIIQKLEDKINSKFSERISDDSGTHSNNYLEDLSLTERFDLIRLKADQPEIHGEIQKTLIEQLGGLSLSKKPHIQGICELAAEKNIPILTTNFDAALSTANGNYRLQGFQKLSPSKCSVHYPWNSFYHTKSSPRADLLSHRIWHIHGTVNYTSSIRLGLRDYMGAVSKARNLIHRTEDSLYKGKDTNKWAGLDTWMNPFFNCDLIIFGLGLKSNEIFLRWLLIERAGYFNKYTYRRRKLYYLTVKEEGSPSQKAFIQGVGGDYKEYENHDELYSNFS